MSSLLPLIVLPLEPSDLPTVSLIYTTAFLPGAFGQALYSQADPKEITRLLDARLAKLTSKPRQKLLKAVRGGQIVGFAWFCEPEPEAGAGAGSAGGDSEEPGEEPEEEAREFAPGTRIELLKQFGNDLEAHAKTVVGRHWHRKSSLGWGVATRWCKAACRCSSRYFPVIADVHTSLRQWSSLALIRTTNVPELPPLLPGGASNAPARTVSTCTSTPPSVDLAPPAPAPVLTLPVRD